MAPTNKIHHAPKSVDQQRQDYIVGGFLLGVGVSVILLSAGYTVWLNREWLSKFLPFWRVVAALVTAPLIGFGLFIFRQKRKYPYGVLEVVFGTLAVLQPIYSARYDAETFFKVGGGLYIIVRGLDNIDKALEATGNAPEFWKRTFWSKGRQKMQFAAPPQENLKTKVQIRDVLDTFYNGGKAILDQIIVGGFNIEIRSGLESWYAALKEFSRNNLSIQQYDAIHDGASLALALPATKLFEVSFKAYEASQRDPNLMDEVHKLASVLTRIEEVRGGIKD